MSHNHTHKSTQKNRLIVERIDQSARDVPTACSAIINWSVFLIVLKRARADIKD